MSWHEMLTDHLVWAMGIPALIITLGALISLFRSSLSHRQRMAMIERGIHPDDPRSSRRLELEEATR